MIAIAIGVPSAVLNGFQLSEIMQQKRDAEILLAQAKQELAVAREQAKSMRDLADATRGQVKEAAGIRESTAAIAAEARAQSGFAGQSARAAELATSTQRSQLKGADLQFREGQRARLVVDGSEITPSIGNARVTWLNTGQRPATTAAYFSRWMIGPAGKNLGDTPQCSGSGYSGSYTIGRSSIQTMAFRAPTPDQMAALKGGQVMLFIGAVCYDDGFSTRRRTTFCFASRDGVKFHDCTTGNTTE